MAEKLPKLTVSQLTSIIKTTLETSFFGLCIEGEISTFRPSSTGHWYFSLKDDSALINAVVWRSAVSSIGFEPKDGQKVVVTGNLNVFPARGSYQIVCTSMHPVGEGDILAKLEERKRFYAAKGYFDEKLKKKIPEHPKKIAIITSPTGAALQDILQITQRRNSGIDIIILPAVVQGDEAALTIAKRIGQVNDFALADVMIVGRGGGSIEDLLPFSDDSVIEAIHKSEIPVISAVGHEIDWAISDFVADLRASTPSAAAELVCTEQSSQKQTLEDLKFTMTDAVKQRLETANLKLASLRPDAFSYIMSNRISNIKLCIDSSISELSNTISERIGSLRTRLEIASSTIQVTSPEDILKRGYSIVTDSNNRTVKSNSDLKKGNKINIRFAKGKIKAEVTE